MVEALMVDLTKFRSICGTKQVHPEQYDCSDQILKRGSSLIIPGCGFGKTEALLHACVPVVAQGYKCLIVSDKEAAEGTWTTEHLEWEHLKHLRVVGLSGVTVSKRKRLLNIDADIYVVSYYLLKWLSEQDYPDFTFVGADEVEKIKGPTSKFRKFLISISKTAKIKCGATATPRVKDDADYYGIMRWIDGGETLGKTIGEFRARYMKEVKLEGRNTMWKMRSKAMGQKVRDIVLPKILNYEMPESAEIPIVEQIVRCRLSPKSKALYDEYYELGEKALGVRVEGKPPISKMQRKNKLACLTSGFLYNEVIERISATELKETTDIEALMKSKTHREVIEFFDDRQQYFLLLLDAVHEKHGTNENILIAYWYNHEKDQLKKLLPDAVPDTEFSDAEWNSGKIKYGLLQYNRSSRGRNLQKAGNILLLYSRTFGFSVTYQLIRRVARQGQLRNTVFVYALHLVDTVDDDKLDKLTERQEVHLAMNEKSIRVIRK